jgi:hypothetical protein
MKVPQGQLKIARRFNGGSASTIQSKSRRDGRTRLFARNFSAAPSGAFSLLPDNPRLKPWAIIYRLSEA